MLFAWFIVWGPLWFVVAVIVISVIWQVISVLSRQSVKAPPQSAGTIYELTRPCPRCAETVKAAARICRFCGLDLTARQIQPPPPRNQIAEDAFDQLLAGLNNKTKDD